MSAYLHDDPVSREEVILRYLRRTLREPLLSELEDHYLVCDECFEEMGATRLLVESLDLPPLDCNRVGDVAVLRFPQPTELLGASLEMKALTDAVRTQSERRVLIDLSTVSRIDSAGLGILMNCYCHAMKNAGALKLLNPTGAVKEVLRMTRIDSIVQTFDDENTALRSFKG
jgi:anti-sigma B factor antagonist